MLSQGGHVDVAEHGSVEGVDALLGCSGGMCCGAVVHDPDLLDGEARDAFDLRACRMDHQSGGEPLERSLFDEANLATPALLSRCAEDPEPSAQLAGDDGTGEPGTQAGGGDDVVAAGMADAGQGVVLAQHGNLGPFASDPCLECRRHAVGAADRIESLLFQDVGEDLMGAMLLEAEFGVGMDVVRGGEQHIGQLIDAGAHPRLDRLDGRGRTTRVVAHDRMVPARRRPTRTCTASAQRTTSSASSSSRTERRRALPTLRPSNQMLVARANSTCSALVRV